MKFSLRLVVSGFGVLPLNYLKAVGVEGKRKDGKCRWSKPRFRQVVCLDDAPLPFYGRMNVRGLPSVQVTYSGPQEYHSMQTNSFNLNVLGHDVMGCFSVIYGKKRSTESQWQLVLKPIDICGEDQRDILQELFGILVALFTTLPLSGVQYLLVDRYLNGFEERSDMAMTEIFRAVFGLSCEEVSALRGRSSVACYDVVLRNVKPVAA